MRVLDEKISRQLSNIRTDTKQAITVATAVASKSLKAEIQSDIASKARESERQLKLEMQGRALWRSPASFSRGYKLILCMASREHQASSVLCAG